MTDVATILLVDDDAHINRVMNIWLTRHGYTLATAGNGAEGLDIVCAGGIDLVVSDLNMPVMDGVSMIQAVRAKGFTRLPIILLTARCDRDSIAKQLAPLQVEVYPKPFVPSRLVMEVQQRLAASMGEETPQPVGTACAAETESVGSRIAGES